MDTWWEADNVNERLADRARESGVRITRKRDVICTVIEEADDHPDAVQLHRRVKRLEPSVSLATVYRTLSFLEQKGLIVAHDFGNGRTRYEVATTSRHYHMIDTDTGAVIEFSDERLPPLLTDVANRLGYSLTDQKIELKGKRK